MLIWEKKLVLPDSDGVSWSCSYVPATIQFSWILKRPTGAGDDASGRPQELCHVTASWARGEG